ncbi:MAG: FAD-binding protein [Gammaproteobacteria bacterium]|nr:FAD-binding protein [Gammaproteobacteria bacterium]
MSLLLSTMTQQTTQQDILIIGGGFAGLMTAITLAPLGLTILLIDKSAHQQKQRDPRAIALNHGSQQLLAHYQLWPLLAAEAEAIKTVHISEKGRFNKIRFHAHEQGVDALGYVTTGQLLLEAMKKIVATCTNVTCLAPAELSELNHNQRQAIVCHDDKKISCRYRLLIAADGSHSPTRQQLGITVEISASNYQALLSRVTLQQPHQNIAFERFSTDGTIALLPMTQQQCKLVITADEKKMALWKSYDEKTFLQQLHYLFGGFLGTLSNPAPTVFYPLQHLTVNQQIMDGALLIGNAAHTFSPLAAQGLNLAFADIACLTETLTAAIDYNSDFSSLTILQKYLHQRQRKQQFIQQFTQKLEKIFSSHTPLLSCGRQFAVAACQLSPLLHYNLAKRLMGIE